jgi:acetoin utilization protein AcuB
MANVADIMTRQVITIGMDESVRRVRELFVLHGFHHLVVLDRHRPVGVLSDRDLLRNISPFLDKLNERHQDVALLDRRVHQIMTRQPVVAPAEMSLAEAAQTMLEKHVSCLPVVAADGSVLGMVTWRDMLRGLIACECSRPEPVAPAAPLQAD